MQPTLLRYVPWCFRDAPENRRPEATRLESVNSIRFTFESFSGASVVLGNSFSACAPRGRAPNNWIT
jgi:hypothetical protein